MNDNYKRILWYVFATTRGGPTRIRIMNLLLKRPYNMHQISKNLKMDYKTVQHHIKILEENKIIIAEEKKYGSIYFPSHMFEDIKDTFEEIKKRVSE
jgi:DNA-binding transcriptional ArsR family regulator